MQEVVDFDLIISQLLNNVDVMDFSENFPNTKNQREENVEQFIYIHIYFYELPSSLIQDEKFQVD